MDSNDTNVQNNSNVNISLSDPNSCFKMKEVVWGKVKGHHPWPCFINKIINTETKDHNYLLHFFGDNTIAILKHKDLTKYEDGKQLKYH